MIGPSSTTAVPLSSVLSPRRPFTSVGIVRGVGLVGVVWWGWFGGLGSIWERYRGSLW